VAGDVRLALAADVDAIADVIAQAYVDDAWVSWIVAADRRQERVRALQANLMSVVGVPYGEVWLSQSDDGSIVGAAVWLLADRDVPPEAWAKVATAEAELMGDRMEYALGAAAATRHLRPATPHHVLATLGVLSSERGRGVGSALLAPVLERSDRDRVPAYLETSAEDNLQFYARLGFEITDETQVPDGGPPVWAMVRAAHSG
jgi:GNAT superfamily N-acetyltransferase